MEFICVAICVAMSSVSFLAVLINFDANISVASLDLIFVFTDMSLATSMSLAVSKTSIFVDTAFFSTTTSSAANYILVISTAFTAVAAASVSIQPMSSILFLLHHLSISIHTVFVAARHRGLNSDHFLCRAFPQMRPRSLPVPCSQVHPAGDIHAVLCHKPRVCVAELVPTEVEEAVGQGDAGNHHGLPEPGLVEGDLPLAQGVVIGREEMSAMEGHCPGITEGEGDVGDDVLDILAHRQVVVPKCLCKG